MLQNHKPGQVFWSVSYTHLDVYKRQVEYLARRINRKDVLVISADNRSKQFKTISENFDANYKKKLNDYNICLLYTSRCV